MVVDAARALVALETLGRWRVHRATAARAAAAVAEAMAAMAAAGHTKGRGYEDNVSGSCGQERQQQRLAGISSVQQSSDHVERQSQKQQV